MDMRLALYRLAAAHRLDAEATRRLEHLAGLHDAPAALAPRLQRGVAVLGAALVGLGLVFWVAAHWDTLGRFGRFALIEGVVLAMCAGALWRPAARAPLGLLALLAIGGLFAHFGQTYQTGADAWQLFALWAALALPLCLGVRSDVLWAPWALVVLTALSLWVQAHTGHRWRVEPDDLWVHLAGWGGAWAVVGALDARWRPVTGAGVWSQRTALTLAVGVVTLTALGGLFHEHVGTHYPLGLAVLAAAAAWQASARGFDLYGLSAAALAIDGLLVAGLTRALFDRHDGRDPIGTLLLLGLAAAALLAATVAFVLRRARAQRAMEGRT
ncbi:DUF2157 domain-containing protein [Ideonella sp. A 288]|uniref:DUF2157 domain-containing protein n=1 Tax=Ideonella sp. A 288 TaxID=1962181 RepID=UPI000B4B9328|nr:DUF2157 domain-containing protein [Ideonella sp. A 288]